MRRHKCRSYGDARWLPCRVVVGAGRRTQLMASATHRTNGPVQEVLKLCQFAVDVDVALPAQAVGLGVCRVDQSGGLGGRGLHDLGLRH
jgi:hypothetical protein